jgi:high-affinity iron transporter
MKRTPFGIFLLPALLAAFWLLSTQSKMRLNSASVSAPLSDAMTSLAEDEAETRRTIFLLQYIGNDYGRAVRNGVVIDSLEFDEMQRFSQALLQAHRAKAKKSARIRHGLESLVEHIEVKSDFAAIRNLSAQVAGQITKESGLIIFPLATPDLSLGKRLFQENCVSCHGERGAGNGPAADTLNPKPRDLSAPSYLDLVTPFHLYQALMLGVSGTAMPSFGEAFSSEQGWSLAFYAMTLRRGFDPQAPQSDYKFSLQQLAERSNAELQRTLAREALFRKLSPGEVSGAIDYARSRLPELSMAEHLKIAKTKWRQSLACYQRGDSAQALGYLTDGYMQGFEPIEGRLANKVYLRVERLVTEYRWCVEEEGAFKKAAAYIEEMTAILEEILKNPRMLRS